MGKMKNWMNKPITRGDCVKSMVWSYGLLAVVYAAGIGYTYREAIGEKIKELRNR